MSAGSAPVSRLSPCPCGSGKRYKECCGALGAGSSVARRSSYRPAGSDWDRVPEEECDRLGALMEGALAHQVAGRAREADGLYRDVLAVAPRTHDALHMLAMLRWSAGDLLDARRLIEDALLLRSPYPAIEQNRSLIIGSQQARERSALDVLCEQVLPSMLALLRTPGARVSGAHSGGTTVHLIGSADGSEADDAWMLRQLASLLAPFDPVLWSAHGADTAHLDGRRIEVPDATRGRHPRGGLQVFVGIDVDCDVWLPHAAPEHTIVFAQSARPSRWHEALRAIACDGACPIDLVVESCAKAGRFGAGHHVLLPPIAVDARIAPLRDRYRRGGGAFTVGVVAQDGRTVARAESVGFLRAIAAKAGTLRLYDPGRLRYALGDDPAVMCVSRREAPLAAFLGTLDVYLYRAREWWREGAGRDLFGAMAHGVPVVCPRASIYAEYLDHGVDALLHDSDDEALEFVAALRADPNRTAAIGAAGRETARRLFDPAALAIAYERLVTDALAAVSAARSTCPS